MKAGGLAEPALNQVLKTNGSVEEGKDDSSVIKVSTLLLPVFYDFWHLYVLPCAILC